MDKVSLACPSSSLNGDSSWPQLYLWEGTREEGRPGVHRGAGQKAMSGPQAGHLGSGACNVGGLVSKAMLVCWDAVIKHRTRAGGLNSRPFLSQFCGQKFKIELWAGLVPPEDHKEGVCSGALSWACRRPPSPCVAFPLCGPLGPSVPVLHGHHFASWGSCLNSITSLMTLSPHEVTF